MPYMGHPSPVVQTDHDGNTIWPSPGSPPPDALVLTMPDAPENLAVVDRESGVQKVGTWDSGVLQNVHGRYLHVICDVTAAGGTATLRIAGVDPASGKDYPLLTAAAITSVGTTVYKVGPGLTVAADSTNDHVPRQFRITVDVTGDKVTFSVGHQLGG